MTMRYKSKCVCQTEEDRDSFIFANGVCWMCHGKGESEYDLSLEDAKLDGEFSPARFYSESPEEPTDASISYEDISVLIKCSCGDEVFFGDMYNTKVCSCVRIYNIDVVISKDDIHKGDMEYWDKIKKEKYE